MGPNITFDGFGFNNANDEYKERLATLSKTFHSEKDRQKFGQYVETAVNSHADLLAALHTAQGDYMMLYAEAMATDRNITRIVDMVHTAMTAMDAAIKRAKGAL